MSDWTVLCYLRYQKYDTIFTQLTQKTLENLPQQPTRWMENCQSKIKLCTCFQASSWPLDCQNQILRNYVLIKQHFCHYLYDDPYGLRKSKYIEIFIMLFFIKNNKGDNNEPNGVLTYKISENLISVHHQCKWFYRFSTTQFFPITVKSQEP